VTTATKTILVTAATKTILATTTASMARTKPKQQQR
jgi:hypothetical protein